jgi:ankyrin repeat protein
MKLTIKIYTLIFLNVSILNAYNKADLEKFKETAQCQDCDLSGLDLRETIKELRDNTRNSTVIGFFKSIFSQNDPNDKQKFQIDLRGSNLSNTNFEKADLSDANLENTTLFKANLHKTNLSGTKLQGAYFQKANLFNADLTAADYSQEAIKKAYLTENGWSKFMGMEYGGTKLIDAAVENNYIEALDNYIEVLESDRYLYCYFFEERLARIFSKAIEQRNPEIIRFFVTHNRLPEYLSINDESDNNKKYNKYNPITYALEKGNIEAVKAILEAKEPKTLNLNNGEPDPLSLAIKLNNLEIVKLLLEKGATISQKHFENAIQNKKNKVIELFLDKGLDPNQTWNSYAKPLRLAKSYDNLEAFILLIEKGAKWDYYDLYPFIKKKTEIDKFLVNKADTFNKNNLLLVASYWHELELINSLINQGADVNFEESNETPLIKACSYDGDSKEKQIKSIQCLINNGADINKSNTHGITPLTAAIKNKDISVFKLLLENGADINRSNTDGITPLTYAIEDKNADAVKILLENGAQINTRDKNGRTPLMLSLSLLSNQSDLRYHKQENDKKRNKIIQILLDYGADIHAVDNEGNTTLDYYLKIKKSRSGKIVNFPLEKSFNLINAQNENGLTPLLNAIIDLEYPTDEVKLLLEHGANTEATNAEGETALLIALEKVQTACVKLLLDHGANTQAKNKDGKTALDYALEKGYHGEIIHLLHKASVK